MKLRATTMVLKAGLFALPGCMTLERGTVDEKLSPDLAYIYLGSHDDLQVGDRVAFFNEHCTTRYPRVPLYVGGVTYAICTQQRAGEGTVVRVLTEGTSLVEVDPGVAFASGTMVEREARETREAH